jgi:hypothetical protein
MSPLPKGSRLRRPTARAETLGPRISRFQQFLRDFLLDDNEALRRPHPVFDSAVLMTRAHYEVRRLASYLLVFLQSDLNLLGTASVGALTKEVEIPRHLLHRGAESERSLFDALVHVTEERFVCGEPGGVQELDVTTAGASSLGLLVHHSQAGPSLFNDGVSVELVDDQLILVLVSRLNSEMRLALSNRLVLRPRELDPLHAIARSALADEREHR